MIIDELVALLGYKVAPGSEAAIKSYEQGLKNIEKTAQRVGAAIGKMAALAGTAAAAGFGLLGKSVLDTAGKFEQFETTLTTIEGSSEKARKSMDWISTFARQTPYEVEGITRAFVKLKAYGIDPMDGTMKVLGDTASAMGKDLNSAVEAFADAATGEFERLKEFGITSKTQGDKVTFAWTENGKAVNRTVKKNSEEIRKFLTEVFGGRFGGAMEKQSKTFKGMMSNLGDAWADFERRIANAGFFDNIKKKLDDLLGRIDAWDKDGTLKKAADFMSALFTGVADAVGMAMDRIGTHTDFISKNWEKFRPILQAVGVALGVLVAWAFPLATGIAAAALALDDFMTYLEGGDSIIGDFLKEFPLIEQAFKSFYDWIRESWGKGDLFEWTKREIRNIKAEWDLFVQNCKDLAAFLNIDLTKIWPEIQAGIRLVKEAWNLFVQDCKDLWTWFEGLGDFPLKQKLTEWIESLPITIGKLGGDIIQWMMDGFNAMSEKFTSYLTGVFKNALSAAMDYLKSWIPGMSTKASYEGGEGTGGMSGGAGNDNLIHRASISSTGGTTGASGASAGVSGGTGGGGPTKGPFSPGKGGDPRNMEQYIRDAAVRNGIDPDTAVRVAASEGLGRFHGDIENGKAKSFGAFQLYTGGKGGGGLGSVFQKETGLDPSDPANEKATIDFALKHAKRYGWGSWYGAKHVGVGNREGIDGGGTGGTAQPAGGTGGATTGRLVALNAAMAEAREAGLTTTSGYRDPSHRLSKRNPRSQHIQGLAFDLRAKTGEQADAAIAKQRALFGARGLEEGRDYKILDEVRKPSGHATAPHVHVQMTPRGSAKYQESLAGKGPIGNMDANTGKMDGKAAGASVNTDRSNSSSSVSVQAPVNVNVAKPDDAPDATARAVGQAVTRGAGLSAKPARMQGSAAA